MNVSQHAAIAKALKFAEQGPHGDLAMNADRAAGIALEALKRNACVIVPLRDLELAMHGFGDAQESARDRLKAALDSHLGINTTSEDR